MWRTLVRTRVGSGWRWASVRNGTRFREGRATARWMLRGIVGRRPTALPDRTHPLSAKCEAMDPRARRGNERYRLVAPLARKLLIASTERWPSVVEGALRSGRSVQPNVTNPKGAPGTHAYPGAYNGQRLDCLSSRAEFPVVGNAVLLPVVDRVLGLDGTARGDRPLERAGGQAGRKVDHALGSEVPTGVGEPPPPPGNRRRLHTGLRNARSR